MGDLQDVITGRSSMRTARPLLIGINTWRREMEEVEVRPDRGRGAWGLIGRRERVPGGGGTCLFREGKVLSCYRNPPIRPQPPTLP